MCNKYVKPYVGDLDAFFAYRTTRTLVIRDRKLGYLLYSMQAIIFIYVVLWQILFSQVYMAQSDFAGVVRLQLQAPAVKYRWSGGSAPYCLGTAAVDGAYPLAPQYTAAGGGHFTRAGGFSGTQRHCQFFDEVTAVPIPETDRMFLTTETRLTAQAVAPAGGACAAAENIGCTFLPLYNKADDNVTRRSFVADVEFFTLLIDHNMAAPLAGIARTVKQMEGAMETGAAPHTPIDPCDAYKGFAGGCDRSVINVGVAGYEDIVSVRTLLQAAGINSLDDPAGIPGDSTTTYRESGLVLNLEISCACGFPALCMRASSLAPPYPKPLAPPPKRHQLLPHGPRLGGGHWALRQKLFKVHLPRVHGAPNRIQVHHLRGTVPHVQQHCARACEPPRHPHPRHHRGPRGLL
jgi:hypothetical protein